MLQIYDEESYLMNTPRLTEMNEIQAFEKSCGIGINRPKYHFDGRELKWGENLTKEQIEAMSDQAEIFLLRNKDNTPYSYIFKDGFGTIRTQLLKLF